MSKPKVHWADYHGAICGAVGRSVITVNKIQDLSQITCKRCLRKLTEQSRSYADFTHLVDILLK